MGERTIQGVGSVLFEDLTNGLKAVISMSTFKKGGWLPGSRNASGSKDHFTGLIYVSKDKTPLQPTAFSWKQKLPESADKCKDIKEKLCEISGSWLENVCFDGKAYWEAHNFTPFR